jgi:bifunctional UDP-N-acetylglucosamine pyrophosphorylase/glucosamine-1-phosphate N-acetyltransferase
MLALRAQLEERLRQCARLMEAGVEIIDPHTTYIGEGVEIGAGSMIFPNTTITGETIVGRNCHIGPNTVIVDSRIANDCEIFASVIEGATIEAGVDVGPFSHLRPDSYLESGVHIGNFVEVKGSRLGRGTKAGHFSYIGDAKVGADVNIGAGTVTCNYDGKKKNETVIEDGAFIGSDTMLVAPVRVGRKARTGAGSVVTRDVPAGVSVVGAPARKAPGATAAPAEPATRKGRPRASSAKARPGQKNG